MHFVLECNQSIPFNVIQGFFFLSKIGQSVKWKIRIILFLLVNFLLNLDCKQDLVTSKFYANFMQTFT